MSTRFKPNNTKAYLKAEGKEKERLKNAKNKEDTLGYGEGDGLRRKMYFQR